MDTTRLDGRSPEELEREIERTRESLHENLDVLQDRLSPRARLRRLREGASQVPPESYYAWAALGAVATGTYLALSGLRRSSADEDLDLDDEWLVDIAVPCSPAPPL